MGRSRRRQLANGAREIDLRDVTLLTGQTQAKQDSSLIQILDWMQAAGVDIALDTLVATPFLCAGVLEAFGAWLFYEGQPLYVYLMALTAIQRKRPALRHQVSGAWAIASRWEALEPGEHRHPMPQNLDQAFVVAALLGQCPRLAGVCLLTFLGPARVGEVLATIRVDLLWPQELLYSHCDRCYVRIRKHKSQSRGGAKSQHITILEHLYVEFLTEFFGRPRPAEPLYPFSARAFRRRWDALLCRLGVSVAVRLTPASLRAGGAVAAYNRGTPIADLQWRLRLANMKTLQQYLQEVATATSLRNLSAPVRDQLLTSAKLYEPLLRNIGTPAAARRVAHDTTGLWGFAESLPDLR
jgi:hypothetical protein